MQQCSDVYKSSGGIERTGHVIHFWKYLGACHRLAAGCLVAVFIFRPNAWGVKGLYLGLYTDTNLMISDSMTNHSLDRKR